MFGSSHSLVRFDTGKPSRGEYIRYQEFVCADSWIRLQSQQLMLRMIMQDCTQPVEDWAELASTESSAQDEWFDCLQAEPYEYRSLYCWLSQGRRLFQTADGHPCVIIYSRPDSAVLAREGGHRSVPSKTHMYTAHTHYRTHTHTYRLCMECMHTCMQPCRHSFITEPK